MLGGDILGSLVGGNGDVDEDEDDDDVGIRPNQLVNFLNESSIVCFNNDVDVGSVLVDGFCNNNSYLNRSKACNVRIWIGSMVSDDIILLYLSCNGPVSNVVVSFLLFLRLIVFLF